MKAKQLKFYTTFYELCRINPISENAKYVSGIKRLIALDYNLAIEVWEFFILTHEKQVAIWSEVSHQIAHSLIDCITPLFAQSSKARLVKSMMDSSAILSAVFQYSSSAYDGLAFDILLEAIVSAKVDTVDEILKVAVKNTATSKTFGEFVKQVLERTFIELLKKNNGEKIVMNRKMMNLLLVHINKIKTNEKALLIQRLKEIQ